MQLVRDGEPAAAPGDAADHGVLVDIDHRIADPVEAPSDRIHDDVVRSDVPHRNALYDVIVRALQCGRGRRDREQYTREQIDALPRLSPRRPDLERFFFGNSLEAELDGAGRVMIPSFLTDHASLQKEVVVVGAGERMELWNKAAWSGYRPELMTSVAEVTARVDAGS